MTAVEHALTLIRAGLPYVRTQSQLKAWAETLYFNSERARAAYPMKRNTRPWKRFADDVMTAVRGSDLADKFTD